MDTFDFALLSCTDELLFIFIYQRRAERRGGAKSEKRNFFFFFLACVMIVKWHVSSVQFLDARV